MKAKLVPDKLTKLSLAEAIEAFHKAILRLKHEEPSSMMLAILVAQSALECGWWKSCHNYNVGNAKASPRYVGLYCQFRCNEVIDGKLVWFDPPHAQCNFRAFETAADGVADHIKLLALTEQYAHCWEAARAGEPERYCFQLKEAGYFTANLKLYTDGVVKITKQILDECSAYLQRAPTDPAPPPVSIAPQIDPSSLPKLESGPLDKATEQYVELLQQRLNATGTAPPLTVDGHFGWKTDEAVRVFQRAHLLVVDGICGSRTWRELLREVH
jgi:hypothetical protein